MVSAERVYAEYEKTIAGPQAHRAFGLARDLELLQNTIPEWAAGVGFDQENKHHSLSVDEHQLLTLLRASQLDGSLAVRWAALLHDVGKPESAWRGSDGRLHFYANPGLGKEAHERIGERAAERALTRLRAPAKRIHAVGLLVAQHMYGDDERLTSRTAARNAIRARRFIQRIGRDHVRDLLLLRRCDRAAKHRDAINDPAWNLECAAFEALIAEHWSDPVTIRGLAIDGNDLLELGHSGPRIGEVQGRCLSASSSTRRTTSQNGSAAGGRDCERRIPARSTGRRRAASLHVRGPPPRRAGRYRSRGAMTREIPGRYADVRRDEFMRRFARGMSLDSLEQIEAAYAFSKGAHRNQLRDDGVTRYFEHCKSVAWILGYELDLITDWQLIVIALLHDAKEDTFLLSDRRIEINFGATVRQAIADLSKVPGEPHAAYLARLLEPHVDHRALLVKLADRLQNLRTLDSCAPEKRARKRAETLELYGPLIDAIIADSWRSPPDLAIMARLRREILAEAREPTA